MSKITQNDVEYVAGLAQLDLDDAAKSRLVQEMSDILSYMDKLNELDTDGVEPMMHAMALTNIFREDEVKPSMPRELALRGAPMHDTEYFMVPKILDAEGGGA
ncbi:MAG: Asp-tRNA(Asn)/Glu-tRNA(Gln) amidotransferase subunit GatC [Candidatus Eremiobacteraeota bacterium]|nr:Asp-tRNA(Asn)/Glu-tRNA(Gln) amidotransferase subunit GatC [Candidatus Eremiobacteraeota bacterium]